MVEFHFSAGSCPDLPTPFVEESIFTPFYALLVGMQTGAATVENSIEFPQKTENGTAF